MSNTERIIKFKIAVQKNRKIKSLVKLCTLDSFGQANDIIQSLRVKFKIQDFTYSSL